MNIYFLMKYTSIERQMHIATAHENVPLVDLD